MTRRLLAVTALAGTGAMALGLATTASAGPVPVRIAGSTYLVGKDAGTTLNDQGTVKGAPVGSATIAISYTLLPKQSNAKVTWTMTNASGTVTGKALTRYTTTNLTIVFTGKAGFTGGTGKYAGIKGANMEFNAVHSKTGKKEAMTIVGTAVLPGRR